MGENALDFAAGHLGKHRFKEIMRKSGNRYGNIIHNLERGHIDVLTSMRKAPDTLNDVCERYIQRDIMFWLLF